MSSLPLLTPNWPVASHVRSACSLRGGGVSVASYDSLNLGDHVGDDVSSVAANRAAYANALGAHPVYLKQVHGWDVVELSADTPDGTVADACITTKKGLACTIMVADCLPVLFTNRAGTVVGAAHAGWRGLCGQGGVGVLEQFLKRFKPLAGIESAQRAIHSGVSSEAEDVLVWLGPCIGPAAFEVGIEVREAFVQADPDAAQHFKSAADGKFLGDLQALARQRLAKLGITQIDGNDGSKDWCTVSNPSSFFSHRRDRVSGRFAASIWLT
ncbi:MAG: peptidoglycan editing factor PgeF [Brachymonas sp.]|nr:peptidoglycan editing factor PgeF [Brachymonas sp.]